MKFVSSFILAGLMPLIILGYFLLDAYFSQSERFNQNNLEQMTLYMTKNTGQFLTDYNELSKLMYDVNWYDQLSQAARGNQNNIIDNWLVFAMSSNTFIENAYFIPQSSREIFFRSRRAKDFISDEFPYTDYTLALDKSPKSFVQLPAHKESYFRNSDRMVVTFSRHLLDKSTLLRKSPKILGTFIFDVDVNHFKEIISELNLGEDDEIVMLSSGGIVNYSNNEARIGSSLLLAEEQDRAKKDNKTTIVMDIPGSDQRLIGFYAGTGFLATLKQFKVLVIVVSLICVSFLFVLAILFSRRFSHPIRHIIRQMGRMESGDLDIHLPVTSEDELGQLTRGMNRMASQLSRFIQEAYVAEIRQQQTELDALRSQIRPHYLYNTLEVIRMSAVSHDDMPVADMIHSLSGQLQYVLDFGESTVRLEEEIANVRDYFKLIKVRYEERVSMKIMIAPEVSMRWGVPKLSIQPLIENAVRHGLLKKREGGQIRLEVKVTNDSLAIWVIDDGVGIDEQRLRVMKEALESGTPHHEIRKSGGFGLCNVHRRIESMYGEKYGITMDSVPQLGTSVQILIPIIREIDRNDKRVSG